MPVVRFCVCPYIRLRLSVVVYSTVIDFVRPQRRSYKDWITRTVRQADRRNDRQADMSWPIALHKLLLTWRQCHQRPTGHLTRAVCDEPQTSANPLSLTLSTPAVPNCRYSNGPAPYRSNPPFLIFDIRALWRSVLSARAPECQKLKMVG